MRSDGKWGSLGVPCVALTPQPPTPEPQICTPSLTGPEPLEESPEVLHLQVSQCDPKPQTQTPETLGPRPLLGDGGLLSIRSERVRSSGVRVRV